MPGEIAKGDIAFVLVLVSHLDSNQPALESPSAQQA